MIRNADVMANYRIWLTQELTERKRKNPAYSLRALAAAMGVSPGYLSKVMNGKRPLTVRSATRIAQRLDLAPDERRRLLHSVRGPVRIEEDEALDSQRQVLELDIFRSIADWYHYAILSLSEVEGSRAKPEWIAQRLGISAREAAEALARLERLGLIEIRGQRYVQSTQPLETSTDIASSALRKFHAQNLRNAERSLERDPVEAREFSSTTMAIDPRHLPEAKRLVRQFRQRLSKLLETGKRERVYTVAIQLFPLDRKETP